MATAGHFVRERIPIPHPVTEAVGLVLGAISASRDTTAQSAGPMTFSLTRRYRPGWATMSGFLIVPLFVRNSEVCRMAVIQAAQGSELLLEGTIDPELHDHLIQLGRSHELVPSRADRGHAAGLAAPALAPRPISAPEPAGVAQGRSIDLRQPAVAQAPVQSPIDWESQESPTLLPRDVNDEMYRPPAVADPSLAAPAASYPGARPPAAASVQAAQAAQAAPAAAVVPSVHVSVDTGEQAEIESLLIIGRAPSRTPQEANAHLLTVNDPSLSVSKSHLAVEIDQQGLWVTDRNSTNGSWIDDGRGALRPVPAQQRTLLPPGARVLIGERILTFTR